MTLVGVVKEIWRYPVKSMRGERVTSAAVETRGLIGDRRFAVYDADGKIGSGKITRRFRPILGLRGLASRLCGDAIVIEREDGTTVEPDDLSRHLGQAVTLREEADIAHHDAAPLHLLSTANLAWIADRSGIALDAFAFRPNILFDTERPWPTEQGWIGCTLAIGDTVRLLIVEPTERCIMVNVDEDGGIDDRVLRTIARENDACLGVYAQVLVTGTITVGDRLTVQS